MSYRNPDEPPRWRQLCEQLKNEKNPAQFQALLDEIGRVLSAFERKNTCTRSTQAEG